MSPLRASMLRSSPMLRTPHQILIFRVVWWMHGSNIVRPVCSRLNIIRVFSPCPRLRACGCPQHRNRCCPRARCIPGVGGTRRPVMSHWGPHGSVFPKQYAFDDFTISQVAKILGNSTDAAKVCIPLAKTFLSRFIICGAVCHESWILC